MRWIPFVILFAFPAKAEDLTHLIDITNTGRSVTYYNASWIPVRCQISSDPDPALPFGTLAEKRNITIRGYQSFTWLRNPDTQIIHCVRLIEEEEYDNR